jgi:hypothetical protein
LSALDIEPLSRQQRLMKPGGWRVSNRNSTGRDRFMPKITAPQRDALIALRGLNDWATEAQIRTRVSRRLSLQSLRALYRNDYVEVMDALDQPVRMDEGERRVEQVYRITDKGKRALRRGG